MSKAIKIITKATKQILKGFKSPKKALQKAGILDVEIPNFRVEKIPIKCILRSGESRIPANQYARLTGNLLRSSQRAIEGPHVKLLEEYLRIGLKVLNKDFFENTEYYRNAVECISFTGSYFPYVRKNEQIIDVAQGFFEAFEGKRPDKHNSTNGHNAPGDLIEVRAIKNSNCYELVHGNHRVASAFLRGECKISAKVLLSETTTPVQDMLFDVLWQSGRVELYQPVNLPEVAKWPILRQCLDRFNLMKNFLTALDGPNKTYIDIGSSYGWFVNEFMRFGYESFGVERDPFAIKIGSEIYGVPQERFFRSDIVDFLTKSHNTYDIVSCFSVAHHFALGKGSISVEELIEKLDKITRHVLFFDTGEAHEAWFKDLLYEWNPDFIEKFLKTHTKFSKIIRLGKDQDNRGEFISNYGRTLFACVR